MHKSCSPRCDLAASGTPNTHHCSSFWDPITLQTAIPKRNWPQVCCAYPVTCLSTDPSRARKARLTAGTFGPLVGKQQNQAAAHTARNPAPFSILQVSRNAQKGDFWIISLPFPPEPGDHLCWLVQLLPLLPGPQPRSGTC